MKRQLLPQVRNAGSARKFAARVVWASTHFRRPAACTVVIHPDFCRGGRGMRQLCLQRRRARSRGLCRRTNSSSPRCPHAKTDARTAFCCLCCTAKGQRYGPGLSRAFQRTIRILVSRIPGDLQQKIFAAVPGRVHRAADAVGLHHVAGMALRQGGCRVLLRPGHYLLPEAGPHDRPKSKVPARTSACLALRFSKNQAVLLHDSNWHICR